MKKQYTMADIEELPSRVKHIYLAAIMNTPILKMDWDIATSEYPEYFTEEIIERLSKIGDRNKLTNSDNLNKCAVYPQKRFT